MGLISFPIFIFSLILSAAAAALEVAFQASESSLKKVGFVLDEPFYKEAHSIASALNVPCILRDNDDQARDCHHLLRLLPFEVGHDIQTYSLSLESCTESQNSRIRGDGTSMTKRRKQNQKPFYINLCPEDTSQTGKRGSKIGGSDLLIKAVGPTKCDRDGRQGCIIYDLTAGLGQDSLVLALNGAREIHMFERDPIVAALLHDAIRRLEMLATVKASDSRVIKALELSKKLFLHPGDSMEVMPVIIESGQAPRPDVIYLDPMFPPRTKSAKVKKGMALLHGILETQNIDSDSVQRRMEEECELLEEAYKRATTRVVVKRPLKAQTLGAIASIRPSYAIEGSLNRWDVYVK